ncbi:MAG: hypothetical protein V5A72_02370 [Candidatus Nanohaloarchaea archaeon]
MNDVKQFRENQRIFAELLEVMVSLHVIGSDDAENVWKSIEKEASRDLAEIESFFSTSGSSNLGERASKQYRMIEDNIDFKKPVFMLQLGEAINDIEEKELDNLQELNELKKELYELDKAYNELYGEVPRWLRNVENILSDARTPCSVDSIEEDIREEVLEIQHMLEKISSLVRFLDQVLPCIPESTKECLEQSSINKNDFEEILSFCKMCENLQERIEQDEEFKNNLNYVKTKIEDIENEISN